MDKIGEMLSNVVMYYAQNPEQLTLQFVLLLLVVLLFVTNGRRVSQILAAKDKEIERLAEDNRRYREIYLTKVRGMALEDYNALSAIPAQSPTEKEAER